MSPRISHRDIPGRRLGRASRGVGKKTVPESRRLKNKCRYEQKTGNHEASSKSLLSTPIKKIRCQDIGLFEDSLEGSEKSFTFLVGIGFLIRVPVGDLRTAAVQSACVDRLGPGEEGFAVRFGAICGCELAAFGADIRGHNSFRGGESMHVVIFAMRVRTLHELGPDRKGTASALQFEIAVIVESDPNDAN